MNFLCESLEIARFFVAPGLSFVKDSDRIFGSQPLLITNCCKRHCTKLIA